MKKRDPEKSAEIEAEASEIIMAEPLPPSSPPARNVVEFVKREKIAWADLTAGGSPKQTMINAMLAIKGLELTCEQDVFTDRYSVNGRSVGAFKGELSDAITRKIRELSRMRFGLDPGKDAMSDALKRMCEENRFHPIKLYLNGLVWDGVPRLDGWLTTYCGVKATPLTRAQGRIVLMAAVRRIFEPGCKFDHVLVLEGPEGTYKSSVCRVLANGKRSGSDDYFSDSPILNYDERKQMELTTGKWIYELAELAGMRKADQFAIKNFITKSAERARAAYAEFTQSNPRSCIFIGTFNTTPGGEFIEYLNPGDQRRWWSVLVGVIDIDALIRDRDQLFAEAMFEYEFGECDLFLPTELEIEAKAIAKTREKADPLADTLSMVYRDVLRMRKPVAKGEIMLTTDGKPVTRLEADERIMLTKGDEAGPFAIFEQSDSSVWVSSKYVGELVPSTRKSDGVGIASAMRSLGWVAVNDRRSGDRARGWLYAVPEMD